ncbi:hypothetical protein GOARA_009_00210 [Gordonia araii NBRC 100433]|uniref:Low molecular weight antigen MTB12-like C-terminal domain-containing protein n=1 Tax=Gordonia araii NBRC 100433 TaxID=1073574 RepID=G7GXP8_9ACTN|nr:hypothetical protein [Gordonia araii]NNG99137.1 DUF4878 domain-containing protein [Gordonia araii NBRC 100433]GAB08373.1 hypothetical protein GOARA_009_00210 [Gordonia araii NBRC 100433]
MNRRIIGAVTALLAVFALFGLAGCSSSDSGLEAAKAQEILRTLVDPSTTPEAAAALVNSTDPATGQKLHGFAQGASRGGYTPDKFTVKSVEDKGETAVAQVEVASPHAPAPVTVPYTFDKVDGTWKLSSASADALVGMGAARSHH